jgi:hypothetical protein
VTFVSDIVGVGEEVCVVGWVVEEVDDATDTGRW